MNPETFNAWRIAPRLMVVGYALLLLDVSWWFMALEVPTTQQTTFVSLMVRLSSAIFGVYVNSGNNHVR